MDASQPIDPTSPPCCWSSSLALATMYDAPWHWLILSHPQHGGGMDSSTSSDPAWARPTVCSDSNRGARWLLAAACLAACFSAVKDNSTS